MLFQKKDKYHCTCMNSSFVSHDFTKFTLSPPPGLYNGSYTLFEPSQLSEKHTPVANTTIISGATE